MRYVSTASTVVAALLGIVIAGDSAIAQSNPTDAGSYARNKNVCYREGGLRQNLMGDDLAKFMTQCMSDVTTKTLPEPANASAVEAAWRERCKTEGESKRSLSGDQLSAFVNQCMGQ